MKKLAFVLFFYSLFVGQAWCGEGAPHVVMLILGSDNPQILSNRVEVAHRLYRLQKFDKIVVSGGCAAHGSSICEATEMHDQLVAKGVPSSIIYKEESSKTTVQNYIFSRALKDENGQLVIQPGDSLYVVSDHWHAISVAARFEKYDGVVAQFYIEGNIKPKGTEILDYGKIFTGIEDNDIFILRGLWPTPDAVMDIQGKRHYWFDKQVYVQNSDTTYQWLPSSVLFPNLPTYLQDGVDEIVEDGKHKRWIFIKGDTYSTLPFSNVHAVMKPQALSDLIKGLPTATSIEMAYIEGDRFYITRDDKAWVAKLVKGKQFEVERSIPVRELFSAYPFNWGKLSPSAAYYDDRTKELSLFKNMEILKMQDNSVMKGYPKRLNLKWPIK